MDRCISSRRGPLSYALNDGLAAALALVAVFLRIDSPVSVKRRWFCISRSSIASAIVASPIHSFQHPIGSWLVIDWSRVCWHGHR